MTLEEAVVHTAKLGYFQTLENENLFSSPCGSLLYYNPLTQRLVDVIRTPEPLTHEQIKEKYNTTETGY